MKKILITSALILAVTQGRASGEGVGNGGFVTKCVENGKNVTRVLDHVEAESRKFTMDLGPANLNYLQKIDYVLNRFQKMDSMRAALYKKWANEFMSDVQEVAELGPLADTGSVGVPQGCQKPYAIIAQRGITESFPGDKRYLVIMEEWNKLNDTAKAGLILHEVVYRDLIHGGWGTSPNTRYLSSMISSKNLLDTPKKQYIDLLKRLGLWTIEIQGIVLNHSFSVQVYNADGSTRETDDPTSGVLAEASSPIGSDIKIKGLDGAIVSGANPQGGWHNLSRVSFYPNGMIRSVEFKTAKVWKNSNYQCTTKPNELVALTSDGFPELCQNPGSILFRGAWQETEKFLLSSNGSLFTAHFKTPVIDMVLGEKRKVKKVGYTNAGMLFAVELAEPFRVTIQNQDALVREILWTYRTGKVLSYSLATPLEKLEAHGDQYEQVDQLEMDEKNRIVSLGTAKYCYRFDFFPDGLRQVNGTSKPPGKKVCDIINICGWE